MIDLLDCYWEDQERKNLVDSKLIFLSAYQFNLASAAAFLPQL